jgi:HemK-related putative methylase
MIAKLHHEEAAATRMHSDVRVARLLRLHRERLEPHLVNFCGIELRVTPEVFCPAYGEGSQLLGGCLGSVENETVLDLGTGSGALAILAAVRGAKSVVATDVSALAVECARANALRLKLGQQVDVRGGDLFKPLDLRERFSLVLFNPPFLDGPPGSLLEKAIFDEGHSTLARFVHNLRAHLADGGRALIAFSSAGDIEYLEKLFREEGFRHRVATEFVTELRFLVYELR